MTREGFIEELEGEEYSYEIEKIEGDKIIVIYGGDADFPDNAGYVDLGSIKSLPPGVHFNNGGFVNLQSLTSLSPGVQFNNKGAVGLNSLTSLPPGVEFNNEGAVWLYSIVGGGFEDWKGNIEGIDSKRLLNFMISKGMFI